MKKILALMVIIQFLFLTYNCSDIPTGSNGSGEYGTFVPGPYHGLPDTGGSMLTENGALPTMELVLLYPTSQGMEKILFKVSKHDYPCGYLWFPDSVVGNYGPFAGCINPGDTIFLQIGRTWAVTVQAISQGSIVSVLDTTFKL
jgi:hypothetical protein